MSLQNICSSELLVTLWAAQRYSTLPVRTLSCLFNNPDFLKVLLHFEQLKDFSPVWILSCTFNVTYSLEVLSHIEQVTYLCEFFHKSLKYLPWQISCRTLNSKMVCHQYGFFHVSSMLLILWKSCHTLSNWRVSYRCEFFHESLKYPLVWISYLTINSKIVSSLYEFFHDSLDYEFLATLWAVEWFLSSVDSFMGLQMTWLVPVAEQIQSYLSYQEANCRYGRATQSYYLHADSVK